MVEVFKPSTLAQSRNFFLMVPSFTSLLFSVNRQMVSFLHRALNLPNSSEGKKHELNYVHAALKSNGYPSELIKNTQDRKTRSSTTNVIPEEIVEMFFKMVEPTESRKSSASLPYIKGVTKPLTRVLKKRDVTVLNKPFTTL